MSTLKTTNLQHASAASPAIVLDANSRATLNGLSYPTEGSLSGRNRIINGDMRIDQRNAGASVTPASGAYTYTLDRWAGYASQASKYTVQRNAGSVTPPTGFTNYLGVTSSSAYSVTASDVFLLAHRFEGFNTADLGWGSAGASSITISFWVRSSLTGTFGGSLASNAANNCYLFSYTVNSANTWEQKTITVVGPTTGGTAAFPTDNSLAFSLFFSLGVGSSGTSTAGSWITSNTFYAPTGATSVVGTNGATFYITGVQLEAGSVATPFERRSYGQELALCQRYFETSYEPGNAVGSTTNPTRCIGWYAQATGSYQGARINFAAYKRSQPTMTMYNPSTGTSAQIRNFDLSTNLTGEFNYISVTGFQGNVYSTSVTQAHGLGFHYTASAEL